MNLLLTGASGFIGRNLILSAPPDWNILALYHKDTGFPDFVAGNGLACVNPVSCNLSDRDETAAVLERHGRDWDCCVHLAAKVDIPWSVREPYADLTANVGPLLHLLDGTRVGRLVYFSSGAVYEGTEGEACPETPVSPTLPYAISKLASEHYVRFLAQRAGTVERFLIVRFFGAFGPFEAPHKIYTRLVQTFAFEGSDTYTLYGDGTNLIDAMYVDDAIRAIHAMIQGGVWNATVNLAGGRPLTIEQLVREVASALGVKSVNVRKEGTAHERNLFYGSTEEMNRHFGFRPSTSIADGIRRLRDHLMSSVPGRLTPEGAAHE